MHLRPVDVPAVPEQGSGGGVMTRPCWLLAVSWLALAAFVAYTVLDTIRLDVRALWERDL